MRRSIWNFIGSKNIKKEYRRQLKLLITFTLGFTIAFTWRQTTFDLSLALVSFVTKIKNSSTLSILSSTLITVVSVVLIYFSSHWLKERHEFH